MTTTSFVAAIRFPARHLGLQGESRNVYREQQQFFGKDSSAQLIRWLDDGNDNNQEGWASRSRQGQGTVA